MPELTGDESVEDLRRTLAEKQEVLLGVRSERLAAQQASEDAIQAAQLVAEIQRVESNIAQEKAQLEVQVNQDPNAIGAGVLSVAPADSEVTESQEPTVLEPPEAPPIPPAVPGADGEPSVPDHDLPDNEESVVEPTSDPVASEEAPTNQDGE